MARDKHAHIGHVAGRVYHCLERCHKPASVLWLSWAVKAWPWEVFLALGWLSREDKVRLWRFGIALVAELKR